MDLTSTLHGLFGLGFVVFIAFLFSNNKGRIAWRMVLIGIAMQFGFALFVLKTSLGRELFGFISRAFVTLLDFTAQGASFVFGGLAAGPGAKDSLGFFFAFQVLPTIIFFASITSLLYYLGVMQRVVQGIAWVMARLLGTSGAESLSVAANVFIGQTEAPLVIRPYIATMTRSELLTMMVGGMAHIAGGVMAAYVAMLGSKFATVHGISLEAAQVRFAGHLLAASVMSAPATMVVAKILIPETGTPNTKGTVRVKVERAHANVIDATAAGASDGVRLAINVGAMLIAFIALIALVNALLGGLGDLTGLNSTLMAHYGKPLSLELLLGLALQFVAFAIGVPWADAMKVGSLMGLKVVANEFVAYKELADLIAAGGLSYKAITISTYALCGFANFASIAIQIGGIGPLAETRRSDIASLGLLAVLGGTVATWMTAAIAGIVIGGAGV